MIRTESPNCVGENMYCFITICVGMQFLGTHKQVQLKVQQILPFLIKKYCPLKALYIEGYTNPTNNTLFLLFSEKWKDLSFS